MSYHCGWVFFHFLNCLSLMHQVWPVSEMSASTGTPAITWGSNDSLAAQTFRGVREFKEPPCFSVWATHIARAWMGRRVDTTRLVLPSCMGRWSVSVHRWEVGGATCWLVKLSPAEREVWCVRGRAGSAYITHRPVGKQGPNGASERSGSCFASAAVQLCTAPDLSWTCKAQFQPTAPGLRVL